MQREKLRITNILMLTIAGIINAFGITIFLAPVNLYDSGISGTSMLLDQLTPHFLTLSIFLIALNIPLFLFGLKKQGWLFTVYAIYAVCIYSVCAWLITDVLPIDVSIASPLAGQDLLLCALFGGMISGIGVRNVVENKVDFTSSRNVIIAALILVLSIGINYSAVGAIVIPVGKITISLSGLAVAAVVGILLNAILPGKDYEFGADLQGDTSVNFKV